MRWPLIRGSTRQDLIRKVFESGDQGPSVTQLTSDPFSLPLSFLAINQRRSLQSPTNLHSFFFTPSLKVKSAMKSFAAIAAFSAALVLPFVTASPLLEMQDSGAEGHNEERVALATVYSSCKNSKQVALTFDDGPYVYAYVFTFRPWITFPSIPLTAPRSCSYLPVPDNETSIYHTDTISPKPSSRRVQWALSSSTETTVCILSLPSPWLP